MENIALNRLNLLALPKGEGLDTKRRLTFLAELTKMGYRFKNPELLAQVSPDFFLDYRHLTNELKEKKGGKVAYVPLFNGFPDKVPDQDAYFVKRLLGYVANTIGGIEEGTVLSNGVVVPNWLFDIENFGADPITQFQSSNLFKKGKRKQQKRKKDSHVEWTTLTIVFEEELASHLQAYMLHCLYAKSSIKETLKKEILEMVGEFGTDAINPDNIVMKETKALLLAYFWGERNHDAVRQFAKTPIDLLRLFAALTDTDVSLSENIRFPKLKRSQRKLVLSILENCTNLGEDLNRFKGLWLELGRYLHPGEYAQQFPKTAEVFDTLRNGKVITFNGLTERLISNQNVPDLLAHLSKRPALFGRKLHELLAKFPKSTEAILLAFEKVLGTIPVKNLLVLQAYFDTINDAKKRAIINKKGKIIVLDNQSYKTLTNFQVGRLRKLLNQHLKLRFQTKESWEGKFVWVDYLLANYTVPFQQRKASEGLLTVGRGSRISVDFNKVLRLFVYWKEWNTRTDLDLSVIQFDHKFNPKGHVSYTNLKADGIVHSGDIQSAPFGAAEFIDISLNRIAKGVRYLAVQVYRYAGNQFADMDCHAGWMMRKEVDANYQSFDIKTVVNKFDLKGMGAYAIPLVVDLKTKEIIATDLYVSRKQLGNNVQGSTSNVSVIAEAVSKFIYTRPNLYSLAMLNVDGRNGIFVPSKAEADITIGLNNCDYNATEIEKILTELV